MSVSNPSSRVVGRRPTSADVAREVGLSRTTVSFVLNNTPHQKIPEETRRRVLEAASRLGYRPSPEARALVHGRSDIVLCIVPDIPIGPAVGRLLDGLSRLFDASGLTFVACPRSAASEPLAQVWTRITPAAVISIAPISDDDVQAMQAAGIEFVVTAFEGPGEPTAWQYSNELVGRLQVEHLADRGHRRIGYAYPEDPRMASIAGPRLAGATAGCSDLGIDAPQVVSMELTVADAVKAIMEWRSAPSPVTAVCAYNDDLALAVLAGLRKLGMRAPEDIAVIGMDDLPAAAFAEPPLTSINPDATEYMHAIAETVLSRIRHTAPPPGAPAHYTVVHRKST